MSNKLALLMLVSSAALFATACSTTPYAIIDGTRSQEADTNNFDVQIVSIDGKMEFGKKTKKVEPGFHYINIVTTKPSKKKTNTLQMYPVDAKECMRYIVTAQHANELTDDWEIRVLREEPIEACVPSQEPPQTIELPSHLTSSQPQACLDTTMLAANLTPAELYPSLHQCVLDGEDTKAIYNYVLASAYGHFDSIRVVDTTAHDAINTIQKHSIWTLSALEQDNFQAKLTAFIDDPERMHNACIFLHKIGPPNYYPEYMVEHGVKKLTKENPNGLNNELDADATWSEILRTQIRCN